MAATKRNFRKKSKSLRRKGGKRRTKNSRRARQTKSRGRRSARGGSDAVTVIPFNDPNIPQQVRTWSSGCVATPTNFVRVLFSAIENKTVNVVSLNKEAGEESTIITRAVYSRDSSLASEMLQRNEDCEITDTTSGEKWMAKFLSFPSGPIRPESFPQYLWFYQV